MMEVLEIYSYSTLAFLVCIVSTVSALVCRFRKFYQAYGCGVVSCVLLNLVATQLAASLLYTTTAVLILVSNNGDKSFTSYITFFNNTGTSWVLSVTLVHVIVLTCLRIYSVSYMNRFLKFVGSSFNIGLVLVKQWFVSLAITTVTMTSPTFTTDLVFYAGVAVTGLFATMMFFCTMQKHSNPNQLATNNLPHHQNIFDGVRNPQKTFVVFTGIIASFVVFMLPACVTNLYFDLQKKQMDEEISLIVSLWCSLGVLANSVWIWYRFRYTLNHKTSFYYKWMLEEHNKNTHDDNGKYMDDGSDDCLPKRHSFRSCDVLEAQYASIASLEEQIRKDIMLSQV